MKYLPILLCLSITVTILKAFYYRNSDYKYYFWLHALNDVCGFVLWNVFTISAQFSWIPISYLLLFSLSKSFFIKWRSFILLALIPVIILNVFTNNIQQQYFVLGVNIILLVQFIILFIGNYSKNHKLDLFYTLIFINQSVIITSFISFLHADLRAVNTYYAGIIALNLIGILLIMIHKKVPQISDSKVI